jgi:hypothetical protein
MTKIWTIPGMALLAGCNLNSTVPLPQQFGWQGELEGLAEWESISGDAGMIWTEGDAEVQVGLSITGDEPGSVRPWFLRLNTCAEGGDVLGFEGNYPQLVIDNLGQGAAEATIQGAIDLSAPLHVSVHLSESDLETVIACADLDPVL